MTNRSLTPSLKALIMKYLTLLILSILCLNVSHAQSNSNLFINMGKSLVDDNPDSRVKGLANHTTFSIDKPFGKHLAIGVQLAHKKLQPANNIKDTIQVIGGDTLLGLRGHYILKQKNRTQLYLGGVIGYRIIHLKKEWFQDQDLNLPSKKWNLKGFSRWQIGLRYHPKIWYGYFLEVGLGNESAAMGICIKL